MPRSSPDAKRKNLSSAVVAFHQLLDRAKQLPKAMRPQVDALYRAADALEREQEAMRKANRDPR